MQVLLNLLSNGHEAIARTTGTGRIVVSTGIAQAEGRSWVTIEVADDGPGVPESYIDRIFEPFFTTREEGTGYGLYLAAAILKEQSGRIRVRNNPEGGATFSIWLPEVDPDDVAASDDGPRARGSRAPGLAQSFVLCRRCERIRLDRATKDRCPMTRDQVNETRPRIQPRRRRAWHPSRWTAASVICLVWLVVVALAVMRLRRSDAIVVAVSGFAAAATTLAFLIWADRARWRRTDLGARAVREGRSEGRSDPVAGGPPGGTGSPGSGDRILPESRT